MAGANVEQNAGLLFTQGTCSRNLEQTRSKRLMFAPRPRLLQGIHALLRRLLRIGAQPGANRSEFAPFLLSSRFQCIKIRLGQLQDT